MIWQGEGLVTSTHKHSESNLIITIFSKDKGIFKTFVRAGMSKKKSAIYQAGNYIEGVCKNRIESGLGNFSGNLLKSYHASFINSRKKTLLLQTMMELISVAIYTGENYPNLYQESIELLEYMSKNDPTIIDFAQYELNLLKEIGFEIDLSVCAVSRKEDELFYVSPKTGHAVTYNIGLKYHDKLLLIPDCFKGKQDNLEDIEKSFKLTGYFLKKHLFDPFKKEEPYARKLLKNVFIKEYSSE
jgi:DNA repair protein RecO (recombination protein O)